MSVRSCLEPREAGVSHLLCTYICTYMHVCMTPIPLTEGIAPIHYTHHQKAPFLDHTFPVSRMSNQIMIPDLIVLREILLGVPLSRDNDKKGHQNFESMFKFYWKLRR